MTPERLAELAAVVREAQDLKRQNDSTRPAYATSARHTVERIEAFRRRCNMDSAFTSASRNWPAVMAELLAELEAARKDAERYRWLTEDHADLEVRRQVQSIGDGIGMRNYASTSASIDAAISRENDK